MSGILGFRKKKEREGTVSIVVVMAVECGFGHSGGFCAAEAALVGIVDSCVDLVVDRSIIPGR